MRGLAILVVLGGCGDVDLSGVYRVDRHVASAPCGTDAPVTTGPAYVRFLTSDFIGTEFFTYEECSDAAATDCTSTGGLLGGFYEPIDDGWLGVTTYASNSGRNCSLGYDAQTALLSGAALVIARRTHEEQLDLPETQCTPDEAEARGDTMPCVAHERIEATRL